MELDFIIAAGLVLIAGSALQSAAGFGFGMFAIPLLILLGSPAYEAIVILSICGTVQTVVGVIALRRHAAWGQIAIMILIAGAALPVGVLVLGQITLLEPDTIRQVFGGIVLVALAVQWLWRVRPRDHLHWGWMALAMPASGFMAGMSGMGGPPAVMWVMAHRWSNPRSRVTLWALFTGLTPFQLFFLHHRFGEDVVGAIGNAALLAPITLLGILPGLWIGHRISKPRLRHISYLILLLISFYAILEPMLRNAVKGP